MLKQRIITAIIALPLALWLLFWGSRPTLVIVFSIFVALGTFEIAKMISPRLERLFSQEYAHGTSPRWVVYGAVLLACLIFVCFAHDAERAGRGVVVAGMLGCILVGSFLAPNNEIAFSRIVTMLLAVTYGAFPWLATWELYIMGPDARYILFLVAVVWSGDTGAYFGGRYFGKTKLAPRMSPNKTREGAAAGLLASLVMGWLVQLGYGGALGGWDAITVAALLGGGFGQMGDLVESTLKRFAQVKDSGFIFPGHGGFLDRVDGVLFAAPVIWFVLYIFSVDKLV